MKIVRTSEEKNQKLPLRGFLNSLFYAFPIGMFLTACNSMFESVRNYYFDWWIVVLPTISIWIIGSLYENFRVYKQVDLFSKRQMPFESQEREYVTSNINLATN